MSSKSIKRKFKNIIEENIPEDLNEEDSSE